MEWITKDEAKKRAQAVAATVPGAKFENQAHCVQVRSRSGKMLVIYLHGSKKRGTDPKLWKKVVSTPTNIVAK
jgi:hypothetical protein